MTEAYSQVVTGSHRSRSTPDPPDRRDRIPAGPFRHGAVRVIVTLRACPNALRVQTGGAAPPGPVPDHRPTPAAGHLPPAPPRGSPACFACRAPAPRAPA